MQCMEGKGPYLEVQECCVTKFGQICIQRFNTFVHNITLIFFGHNALLNFQARHEMDFFIFLFFCMIYIETNSNVKITLKKCNFLYVMIVKIVQIMYMQEIIDTNSTSTQNVQCNVLGYIYVYILFLFLMFTTLH